MSNEQAQYQVGEEIQRANGSGGDAFVLVRYVEGHYGIFRNGRPLPVYYSDYAHCLRDYRRLLKAEF